MYSSKKLLLMVILLLTLFRIWANPFVKPQQANVPDPVRPPTFAAPTRLIDAQLRFREKMADIFSAWEEEKSAGAILSLGIAGFLYGILHALGPGHRKMVIFSLFMARKARAYEPILAGFLSALLHGLSAAAIILAFSSLSNRLLVDRVNVTTLYMEGFTYLLLAILAAVLLMGEIISHRKKGNTKNQRGLYGTIALTSLFPCPAAIMILIFSLTLNLFYLGVIAVAALSLGMGITISFIGFLAWRGRESLMHHFKNKERFLQRLSHILEGGAYLFLIAFSLWMALPFISSLSKVI
jgi:nickel/cobalt transporter (NicO) family protein